MNKQKSHDLDYARAAPPRWIGAVSAAVGTFAVLWMVAGVVIFLLNGGDEGGGKALKAVLLACVPSSLVGLILGLAGRTHNGRWSLCGMILNLIVLLATAGVVGLTLLARLR